MTPSPWRQVYIRFLDWACAEQTAVAHLRPLLTGAEAEQLITAWFFVRKAPCWRVRYLSTDPDARAYLHDRLNDLRGVRQIKCATDVVYEPETHAFGGTLGMAVAHRLWHLDSRHLLAYLAATTDQPASRRRRELSILLCSTMLRAARLDWYEQGDVWARVADHRAAPELPRADDLRTLQSRVHRLMSVDTDDLTRYGPLTEAADWAAAFAQAGRDLTRLNSEGSLHRGLRDVLAHHVVFASNRLGLPAATQAVLADTAKTVVFGPVRPQRPTAPQATTIDDERNHNVPKSSMPGGRND